MANNYKSRKERRQQLERQKAKKRRGTFAGASRFKKIIAIILIAGVVIGLGVTALFAYYASNAPELKASELRAPYSSKLYDMNDDFAVNVGGEERRTRVNYEDLPETYVNSVLATEDVRFFEHSGIDLQRILAAIWANIKNGFGSEGASTITQQVIKQSLLTSDKTLERKVQEQYLALKLDREYDKERIFEMYVNKIYFGQGAYGVAEAAKTFFGKSDLKELTLAESALLAGLPQRPSGYDPYENPDLAKDRMNTVLHLMVSHGKITEEEAEKARQTEISSMLAERTEKTKKFQAFVDQVQKEVESKMEDVDIFKDGLKIYTTLDPEAQQLTEKAMNGEGPVSWPADSLQSSVSVLDTQTGAIRAIGGGRNYVSGGLNFATDDPRQAGSTMKPIAAYGPVIEHEKWSTYHQLEDEETDFNGYSPSNFDNEYRGWMSIREALSQSINVPAVKALSAVGPSRASEFANKLGVTFGDGNMELGDALGTQEVTPIQMSGAYAAFGNEGVYNEPYAVRKVETPENGTVDLTPEPVSAMKDYTAYMVTSMLKTAVESGTGTAVQIPGLPIAGKTGTTNKEVDSWFNGYTTNYSISVWTGNQDRSSIDVEGGKDVPKQMFRHLMEELSKDKDTEDFTKPDSVVELGVEEGSRPAKLPSSYTPSSEIVYELFHVDNQPSDVSAQYEQMDPVSGLSASYDEESDSIDVSWSYPESAEFEITASGGNSATTGDTSYEISSPTPGETYNISVKVNGEGSSSDSESRSTSVEVPAQENEPAEESPDDNDQNNESGENENSGDAENSDTGNTDEDSGNENSSEEDNGDSGNENSSEENEDSGNEGSENESGDSGQENEGSDNQNENTDSQNGGSDSQENDSGNQNNQSDNEENGSGSQDEQSGNENDEAPAENSSSGAQTNDSESDENGSDNQENNSSEDNDSPSQNEGSNSDSPEGENSGTDTPSDNSSDEQYNGSSEEENSGSGQESNPNSGSSGEGSDSDPDTGNSDSTPAPQEDSGTSEQDSEPAPSSSNNSGGSSEEENSGSGQESNPNSGSSGEGSGADADTGSSDSTPATQEDSSTSEQNSEPAPSSSNNSSDSSGEETNSSGQRSGSNSDSSEQSSDPETPATGSDSEESNESSGSYNSSSERDTESSPEQNSGSDAQEENSDPASGTSDSDERSSNADSETPETSEPADESTDTEESDSNPTNQSTDTSETDENSTQNNNNSRQNNDSTE